jgi:cyclopropane-fatty-acyl-phospholipid synthase
MYSCAYWTSAETLDQAQENKLELICQKLKLLPGQRVLDIGCGWGGFAQYAAEKYKVEVVGITISKQQLQLAKDRCANLPVEIRLQDYRGLNEKFDRIVSIGMFEHVGYKNYADYMQTVRNALNDDGLFLLHTIGGNSSLTTIDPWINTYIFPNAMMPSVAQIGQSIENKFILEDWHNLGSHYDLTLMAWMSRFKHAWSQIREKYDERFYRMWIYYLSICAASFRAKRNNLWQIVLSPPTNLNAYVSVR